MDEHIPNNASGTEDACFPYFHPHHYESVFMPTMLKVYDIFMVNTHWSLMLSATYMFAIFSIKHWMKDRTRFDLRRSLILWNTTLAIFSMFGAVRSWQVFFSHLSHKTLFAFISENDLYEHCIAYRFWVLAFFFSKPVELCDTVFIVLRKSQLIFLHWYHHITVMCYVWNVLESEPSLAKVFMMNNYTVHAVMYIYYAASTCGYRVPKWIKKSITLLQLSQMVIGVSMTVICVHCKLSNIPFRMSNATVLYGILMYSSYFMLFAKFYYDVYVAPSKCLKGKQSVTGVSVSTNGSRATCSTMADCKDPLGLSNRRARETVSDANRKDK